MLALLVYLNSVQSHINLFIHLKFFINVQASTSFIPKIKEMFFKNKLTTMYIKRRRVGVRQAHIWSEKVTELMTGVESATFWCKTSSILHTLCDGIRFLFNDFCGFSLSSSWSYSKSSLLWILSVLCGFIYTLARPSLSILLVLTTRERKSGCMHVYVDVDIGDPSFPSQHKWGDLNELETFSSTIYVQIYVYKINYKQTFWKPTCG